jgi:hypothetical protein
MRTRFDARPAIGGRHAEVHLMRRSAPERRVWAVFVVPSNLPTKFCLHRLVSQGDQHAVGKFVFQCPNELIVML